MTTVGAQDRESSSVSLKKYFFEYFRGPSLIATHGVFQRRLPCISYIVIYLSIYLFIFLLIYLFLYSLIGLSIYLFIYYSFIYYLFIYSPILQLIYSFIHLFSY